MTTLRKTQRQMMRNLLPDAGLDLFVSNGYSATTIDDIASEAGTTANLDHVARNWTPGHWGLEHDEMLDVLAESWVGLIGRQ